MHAAGLLATMHRCLPDTACRVLTAEGWLTRCAAHEEFPQPMSTIALQLLTNLAHGVMRSGFIACSAWRGKPKNDRTATRIRSETAAMQSYELCL